MGVATGLFWPGLPGKPGGTLRVSRARRAVVLSLLGCWGPAARSAQPCHAREWWDQEGVFISHLWPMSDTHLSLGFVSLWLLSM